MLLVDLDPQANATAGLGIDPSSVERGMYDVIAGGVEGFPAVLLKDVIQTTPSGIDLAPANLDLAGAEPALYHRERRFHVLDAALTPLRRQYDVILIDTPPSMGQLVINGLIASDHVVVTFDRGIFSINGVRTLLTIFTDIREMVGCEVHPDMAILTRWDDLSDTGGMRGVLRRITALMHGAETAEEESLREEVAKFIPTIFSVPESRDVRASQLAGMPLSKFAPWCAAARAYDRIGEEMTRWI